MPARSSRRLRGIACVAAVLLGGCSGTADRHTHSQSSRTVAASPTASMRVQVQRWLQGSSARQYFTVVSDLQAVAAAARHSASVHDPTFQAACRSMGRAAASRAGGTSAPDAALENAYVSVITGAAELAQGCEQANAAGIKYGLQQTVPYLGEFTTRLRALGIVTAAHPTR